MKERRGPNNKEKNGPASKPETTRDRKPQEKGNGGRNSKSKEANAKNSPEKQIAHKSVNDTKPGGPEEENPDITTLKVEGKQINENSSDTEVVNESDAETSNDSVSSLSDPQTADDEKAERAAGSPVKLVETKSSETSKSEKKASKETPKNGAKSGKGVPQSMAKVHMKVHPKPLSDPTAEADPTSEEVEVNTEENDLEDTSALDQKVEEMEARIKNLESELREVAALEIALYSVVPEHGSSAHKVHTPARRLSRLYIYACKYWSQDKRATVARNTVSGLVLVSKSCGNDVSRLTFWLSNTVVLREIISQAFGSSCQSSALTKAYASSGGETKSNVGSRQSNKQSFLQFVDDWQETRTFTAALEKVESWLFSRIVESIWWQTLTPNMQSPVEDSTAKKGAERLPGPPLGDHRQGNFSIDLWNNAFHDALKRLCPVRAGGHECGCLPVLPRKVMEQCIGRLDVAMFNAILRESVHEIPTDPVSDPIVDSKVLPIPAGDLCFGSGAQLKNSVGSWARWLSDYLGMDADSYTEGEKKDGNGDDKRSSEELKSFPLLNSLSDLLMLPKDMLMDRTVRLEVCPLISLPLVKRILCNFSPDEFCPDPVPGAVLEAVNAECIIERRLSGVSSGSFPCAASPIVYVPPSSSYNVVEKVTGSSAVQRKGHTSDEELDELECCLGSIVDKLPMSPSAAVSASGAREEKVVYDGGNARYDLLRDVWRVT